MAKDLERIAAAREGSAEAFSELVRQYQPGLLRFLVTRCSSVADAEDALQETLMSAFRYLHTYDSRWRFSTWLYRIAIRNAGRLRTEAAVELNELSDDEADPLLQCIRQSESENLWLHARRALSDDVFAALWLRYAADMSVKDIAMALDRSLSWTKVNLLRARRRLDKELGATNGEDEAYG